MNTGDTIIVEIPGGSDGPESHLQLSAFPNENFASFSR